MMVLGRDELVIATHEVSMEVSSRDAGTTAGSTVLTAALSWKVLGAGGTLRATGYLTLNEDGSARWDEIGVNNNLQTLKTVAGIIDKIVFLFPTPNHPKPAKPDVSPVPTESPMSADWYCADSADQSYTAGDTSFRLTAARFRNLTPQPDKPIPAWSEVQKVAARAKKGDLARLGGGRHSATLDTGEVLVVRCDSDGPPVGFAVVYHASDGRFWYTTNDPNTQWTPLTRNVASWKIGSCERTVVVELKGLSDGTGVECRTSLVK
jgi:hypothetical protein